ncbi:MAG: hypothetical protein J6W65_04510 [Oscillospiraceae bacterium]|nr:hypothetical protein [Oscillospiraceae bacterium]MBP1591805.1 hypothetical protein [Oscillospiraceae bacterium]MBQ5336683.1 hypothetical protein [Oscillospiraceae bacterium]
METFDVSQDIDLSYMEEKIEKSLAMKQAKSEMKKMINHPPLKHRMEKAVKEKKPS